MIDRLLPPTSPSLARSVFGLQIACLSMAAVCSYDVPAVVGQETIKASISRCVVIEIYGRQDDPKRDEAIAAAENIKKSRAGITLVIRDTTENSRNQERLASIQKHFKLPASTAPIIYSCNRVIHTVTPARSWQVQLQESLMVEVFVRAGCSRCASAKAWLPGYFANYPGLELAFRDIASDQRSASKIAQLTAQHHVAGASVPLVYMCEQLLVGFEYKESSQERLRAALQTWTHECPPPEKDSKPGPAVKPSNSDSSSTKPSFHFEQVVLPFIIPSALPMTFLSPSFEDIEPQASAAAKSIRPDLSVLESPELSLPIPGNELSDNAIGDLPLPGDTMPAGEANDTINLPVFGRLSASKLGMPLFTLAVGLVDGFNPCAMWVLVLLLSILVNLHDRLRIIAIAGTFVVVSGLAYYAFMAAWINVFLLVGLLRPVQLGLAAIAIVVGSIHIKDFFAFKQGVSLSIPESAKPGIYARIRQIVTAEHMFGAIAGAITLAVLVNIVELLCTAGLPAMYTSILAQQKISPLMRYAYLGLYIIAYMFDDCLLLIAVLITLSKKRLQESQGRWMKLISGLAILLLGIIMIFRPSWLV